MSSPYIESGNRRLVDYLRAKPSLFNVVTRYAEGIGKVNAAVGAAYTSDDESSAYTTPVPTTAALTDNSGGSESPDGTISEIEDIALSTSNTYTDAAVNAAVNAVVDDCANAIEELAAEHAKVVTDLAAYAGLTDLNALRVAVENLRVLVESGGVPHGTTNKWQGHKVLTLADNDELHTEIMVPNDADLKFPIYIRALLIPNHASSGLTLAGTVDLVDMQRSLEGSDTAGDGATSLTTAIAAITDAQTSIDVPMATSWGELKNSDGSLFDCLKIKLVVSGASAAARMRCFGVQAAFLKRKYAANR